jgi:Arc/MetJ-type ribon-helix-helix transcriptional regulator
VSKQIAVRLPDDVVEFIDGEVRERHVASRAAFVQVALERERRRVIAARDAALLSKQAGDIEGFDSLATYAADLETELE